MLNKLLEQIELLARKADCKFEKNILHLLAYKIRCRLEPGKHEQVTISDEFLR